MDLAAKLQLKAGQPIEGVLVPSSVLAELEGRMAPTESAEPPALLVFVNDRSLLETHQAEIVEAASADRLTWVAYPKAGKLGTDLNRDSMAAALIERGVQPVRQIAVDDIWSALRFRPG